MAIFLGHRGVKIQNRKKSKVPHICNANTQEKSGGTEVNVTVSYIEHFRAAWTTQEPDSKPQYKHKRMGIGRGEKGSHGYLHNTQITSVKTSTGKGEGSQGPTLS